MLPYTSESDSQPVKPTNIFQRILNNRYLKNTLLINAAFLWGVNIVASGTGLVFWVLAARMYNSQDVGLASSVISVVQLLTGISSLSLGIGLIKYINENEGSHADLLNTAITFNIASSLVTSTLFLVGVLFWFTKFQFLTQSALASTNFFFYLILTNISGILLNIFTGFRQAKYAFGITLWLNIIRLGLILVLAVYGHIGIILSITLALLFSSTLGLFYYLPKVSQTYRFQFSLSTDALRKIIPFSFGNHVADFIYRAPNLIAPVLALQISGADASAHTYVAFMMTTVITGPALALSQSSFAESEHSPRNLRGILLKSGKYAFFVTLVISLAVIAFPNFFLTVFGKGYAIEASDLLRWLALASPLVAINNIYFSGLRSHKRIKKLVIINLLVGLAALGYPIAFFATQGITSIGIGWLMGQTIPVAFTLVAYLQNRL